MRVPMCVDHGDWECTVTRRMLRSRLSHRDREPPYAVHADHEGARGLRGRQGNEQGPEQLERGEARALGERPQQGCGVEGQIVGPLSDDERNKCGRIRRVGAHSKGSYHRGRRSA